MKSNIVMACVAVFGLSLFAGSLEKAEAQVVVPVVAGPVGVVYDSAGFPVWGFAPDGRPIYAYTPEGLPIYAIKGIYGGCFVPTWAPRPGYHGRLWPHGVHRGMHHRPQGPRLGIAPPPPPGRPPHHGAGPRPGKPQLGIGGPFTNPGAHHGGPHGGPRPGIGGPHRGPRPGMGGRPGPGGPRPGGPRPGGHGGPGRR